MNHVNHVKQENIDRWSGFADIYVSSRPVPPQIITKSVLTYLAAPPQTVVDLGSGTGLSTAIWKDIAQNVIGIEPNDDMRNAAGSNAAENIVYQKGVANQTGLPADSADVVTISQAFHWMDIPSTLDEVFRILKPNGVLAIYDCDWPPSIDWVMEQEYYALQRKCDSFNFAQKTHAVRNDKHTYIEQLNAFGKFRFVKEIVCHSVEPCTPERMIGIALSQGAVQDALKAGAPVQEDIDAFCGVVNERCGENFDIVLSYRLRLAVK